MALSKDKFHLRTEHSKLLGYWTVELGGLNQVTHLWEYDSYSHRAGVRAKLGGHQQWQILVKPGNSGSWTFQEEATGRSS